MMCVTTRFQLKHVWALVPMYLTYRRMRRDLDSAGGLIRYAFLIQSPLACCTFSIWESEEAIVLFSNVPGHVNAVRYAKRYCRDIWSAYWTIDAVSKYAHHWQGSVRWPTLIPDPTYPHGNRLVQPTTTARVAR